MLNCKQEHAYIPISDLDHQVGVVYNCWIFRKLVIGDHVLHEPFCSQKKKKQKERERERIIIFMAVNEKVIADGEPNVNINV